MMQELSLSILDLAENSIRALSNLICIEVDENTESDILSLEIRDDGKGMSSEFVKKITNPFITTRTTRKVGLGIPFIKQICDMCEGDLVIESTVGKGTDLKAVMKLSHIDRPPIGNIRDTIHTLIVLNTDFDFYFKYSVDQNIYEFDTRVWKEILGEVPLNNFEIRKAIKEDINKGLEKIGR